MHFQQRFLSQNFAVGQRLYQIPVRPAVGILATELVITRQASIGSI